MRSGDLGHLRGQLAGYRVARAHLGRNRAEGWVGDGSSEAVPVCPRSAAAPGGGHAHDPNNRGVKGLVDERGVLRAARQSWELS
jgi:hypothetical protein